MAKEFSRARRVGEQLQRELAELIQREVKDPRVGFVTVSAVDVSKDMEHAKVYFSVLGEESEEALEASRKALERASGFLRRELGRRMKLRTIPTLRFVYDRSLSEGNRMSALIDEAVRQDRRDDDSES